MKSLASSEMPKNSLSSKFHWQARMLFSVSLSSSPRNGDRPLKLVKTVSVKNLKEVPQDWFGNLLQRKTVNSYSM